MNVTIPADSTAHRLVLQLNVRERVMGGFYAAFASVALVGMKEHWGNSWFVGINLIAAGVLVLFIAIGVSLAANTESVEVARSERILSVRKGLWPAVRTCRIPFSSVVSVSVVQRVGIESGVDSGQVGKAVLLTAQITCSGAFEPFVLASASVDSATHRGSRRVQRVLGIASRFASAIGCSLDDRTTRPIQVGFEQT